MLCSVSVDLDEIPNYFGIHGLTPPEHAANAVYDVALARLAAFAEASQIPLTLFAIGADVAREESARALRAMAEAGHEIANHTLDHRYDLIRLPEQEMRRQVAGAIEALEQKVGVKPSGFRSPGYTTSDALYRILEELGVAYSSSVFPCPPYYFAKALTLAAMRIKGRSSHSILDTPNVLLAPNEPYRIGTPYWERGAGMIELPVQVTRLLKLPFIGTTITLFGPDRARWLTQGVLGAPFVNLELHGIDLLDAGDGLEALRPYQPDVRVTLESKLASLSAVIEMLRNHGYGFVRLDEAARHFARG